MNPLEILFIVIAVIAFVRGLRATVRLWRLYFTDGKTRQEEVLLAFALISTAITVTAGWFGFLSIRRVAGFDALPWSPLIGIVLASMILLIPEALDRLIDRIAARTKE